MKSLDPIPPKINLRMDCSKVSAILGALSLNLRTLPPCRQREDLRALYYEVNAIAAYQLDQAESARII